MIVILTDRVEPWFKYIWEQFVQINSLNTDYNLTTYSDYKLTSFQRNKVLLIEYGIKQRYPDSLFIFRKEFFKTDDYVWVHSDFPVYRSTILEDSGEENYDIFYNAFVHLSRLEEWETEKKGKFIHSYSFNHPQKDKRIWKIPIVNYLFNELEKRIKAKYPDISFGGRARPVIEFSHDVDYITKTLQLRIKQTCFNLYNCGRFFLQIDFKKTFSKFKDSIVFAFSNCDYWCFQQWAELEKQLNIKSVYYFFANSYKQCGFNIKKWLIEPSYDISNNRRLKDKCKELINNGNKIGIHGSFVSAGDEKFFIKEKEALEHSINCVITKGRQHWLNYYENKTPYIYERSGIKEDSTLGFNDIAGFRAGVASKYNPYDHRNNRPFSFKEIPLVVMDSHLYDYSNDPDFEYLSWLYTSMDNVKNFAISIDWHERAISAEYKWSADYHKLAEKVSDI
jgi:hypothetical protein